MSKHNLPFIIIATGMVIMLFWAGALIGGILIVVGLFKPKAGIVGGIIGVLMFFTTSSMLITTPGALIHVNGMAYMNNLGLFLYKDIINLGASFYLIAYFGKKASLAE